MSLEVSEPKRRKRFPGVIAVNITQEMASSIARLLPTNGHLNQSTLLRELIHQGLSRADPTYRQQAGG
jgi:hypothetical protein